MSAEKSNPVPGLKPVSEENGNLDDIAKAGSLHEFLVGLHKQFGPIASFWWGKVYTVSIASAELFEAVENVFDRAPEPFAICRPLLEPKSIQFANKEEGVKRREYYSKALSDDATRRNIPQLQQVANDLVDKWTKMLKEPRIPISQHTSLFAMKAIIHTLFGNIMKDDSKEEIDLSVETDEVIDEMKLDFIHQLTKEREEYMREAQKDLSELIAKMIKDRKSNPPKTGDDTLLDMIISYSTDEELQHADAMEFIAGGKYTLEYLLTCFLYYVAKHPGVDSKLYIEIEAVLGEKDVAGISLENLVYLRQVIDEILRCTANATWGARVQDVDVKLGGYDIPGKTPVITALGVALKDENVWPSPDKFDPDRFSKENSQNRPKCCFSPFGIGRRVCIAQSFTYAAASVFIVTLMRKFKFSLADEDQVLIPVYGLITHQKEEIHINLTPR